MGELLTLDDLRAAAAVIDGHVLRTPTLRSPGLSALYGVPVTVKLELLQRTGSFKPRGAFAKILGLSDAERAAGVVGVSGGNHGIALADVAGELGVAATVVMPESAPEHAVASARASGADVRLAPDMKSAFALMDELVVAGATLVHPFDDKVVVAAQGTVGLEFAQDGARRHRRAGQRRRRRPARRRRDRVPRARAGSAGVGRRDRGRRRDDAAHSPPAARWRSCRRRSCPRCPRRTSPSSPTTTSSALVDEVLVVPDADAVAGTITLAERQKVWAEPAAGCVVAAAHTVLERVGPDARLGLVICGGNATFADVARWSA